MYQDTSLWVWNIFVRFSVCWHHFLRGAGRASAAYSSRLDTFISRASLCMGSWQDFAPLLFCDFGLTPTFPGFSALRVMLCLSLLKPVLREESEEHTQIKLNIMDNYSALSLWWYLMMKLQPSWDGRVDNVDRNTRGRVSCELSYLEIIEGSTWYTAEHTVGTA